MKQFNRVILLNICIGLMAGAPAVVWGGFVSETGQELLAAADLNGDTLPDAVVLDKVSGTFRIGYQAIGGTFTWSESRAAGATNITGMTTGYLLHTNREALAVTMPLLNRINLIDAPSASQPIIPVAAYGQGYGPHSLAATEIGGLTPYDDLFVSTSMNSYDAGLEFIGSSGSGFSTTRSYNTTTLWNRCNKVQYAPGLEGVALLYQANALILYNVASNNLDYVAARSVAQLGTADYVAYHPDGSGYAHFVMWESGNSSIWHFQVVTGNVFSVTTGYDLGLPIDELYAVRAGGADRLAVVFEDGNAVLYDFDGSGPPTVFQHLGAAPVNEAYSGFIQVSGGAFLLLRGADDGTTRSAEYFAFNGSEFAGSGSVMLPPMLPVRGRGNVMIFEHEPFVSPFPNRLQMFNVLDWTDDISLIGPAPADIEVDYERDAGLPGGLGDPGTVTIGKADVSAGFTLANQAHTAFSVFSYDAAVGDLIDEAVISPDPGHYRTGVKVSFANASGAAIYYRIREESSAWKYYTGSFDLFKNSTIDFLTRSGSARSRIQTARYTFEYDPSSLDSDGDGVPDYVEIANGLDPVQSGFDSDGDGWSDLEELLSGSLPGSAASTPTSLIGVEQGTVYDLVLTPRPYDGVTNLTQRSRTNTQVRVFSASGLQLGYAKTTNLVLSVTVTNPAAHFQALPLTAKLPFLTAVTDTHFDIEPGAIDNQLGVELVGMYARPEGSVAEVGYTYQYGSLPAEASNWVSMARAAFTNEIRTVDVADLGVRDTLTGLLVERKLVDVLYDRGAVSNRLTSLFPGRVPDTGLPAVSQSDLLTLQSAVDGYDSYRVDAVLESIRGAVATNPALASLNLLATGFYDIYSESAAAAPGAYELPVDAIRAFLLDGSVSSNYMADLSMSSNQLSDAYGSSTQLLDSVAARPWGYYSLEVRSNSFDFPCPVLYTAGNIPKSLYGASGNAYLMPFSFMLPAGTRLSVTAFTDVTWDDCPGTDPLEVIDLTVTAIPTSSAADLDGNLLPDAFEDLFLGGGGGLAYIDSDGDGFSDLQEYLEQTDPSDIWDYPGSPALDMSPPGIAITSLGADQVQLDIDWPLAYADPFVFAIVESTNLTGSAFVESLEFAEGSLSTILDVSADEAAFYQVIMRLR